jgi:hypothetical protein
MKSATVSLPNIIMGVEYDIYRRDVRKSITINQITRWSVSR